MNVHVREERGSYCTSCGAPRSANARFCTACGNQFAVGAAEPNEGGLTDTKWRLADLHQRLVQEEPGVLATIDENGYVKSYIVLQEGIPEYMGHHCMFCSGGAHALQDLRRICNNVNQSSLLAV